MILVTDVKIREIEQSFVEIAHFNPNYTNLEKPTITQELVKGRRFVNYEGKDVVIGWDKQTQIALGLPFDVFESMQIRIRNLCNSINCLCDENSNLREQIKEYRNMTLWERIVALINHIFGGNNA